ncbi:hypothetical protein IQ260_00600 [Leptolyngbya cf. ectocarpi LEGE 11479]|uniref:Uncharacterized protein n=1 Tax=Leptolyngbya cf. ectocarpi LEGE 11479 TaxID=1828722 RepID=A0A928WXG7_LEPEC|nr:hypothetical protein [Leptolyngbya ectocarpi]MBE9065152.1 hypothetical protein [Leptolyngbya cf. ectocarpi LEGE 11479]
MSEPQNKPKIVQSDTVVRLGKDVTAPDIGQTFMGYQAPQVMGSVMTKQQQLTQWTGSGATCQVLSPGGEWTTGRVKFVMVFTPDEVPTE